MKYFSQSLPNAAADRHFHEWINVKRVLFMEGPQQGCGQRYLRSKQSKTNSTFAVDTEVSWLWTRKKYNPWKEQRQKNSSWAGVVAKPTKDAYLARI